MGLEGYPKGSILSFTMPRVLADRNLEIINAGCLFGKTKNKINKK